jgi:hypothetical protein
VYRVHGAVVSGNFPLIRKYSSTIKNQRNCIKGLKYIWKKHRSKVHAINKFRDKTNRLSVTECLFSDGTNSAVQGWNVWARKDVEI